MPAVLPPQEFRALSETILFRLLRLHPFITPALARAAVAADGNKPENARPILRRLEAAGVIIPFTLRLVVEPRSFVGQECLYRFGDSLMRLESKPHPFCSVLDIPITTSLRLDTVRVWHCNRMSDGPCESSRIRAWKTVLNEQNEVFHSSITSNKPNETAPTQKLLHAYATSLQNLGFVFIRLQEADDIMFRDDWMTSMPWRILTNDLPVPAVTYDNKSARGRSPAPVHMPVSTVHYDTAPYLTGAFFARSLEAKQISVLFDEFEDLMCQDVEIW